MDKQQIDKAYNDKHRAGQASAVLNNEIYQEAMIIMEAELINELRNSGFEDKELREDIHKKLQVCQWFNKRITKVMTDGKIAEQKLSMWDKMFKNKSKLKGM